MKALLQRKVSLVEVLCGGGALLGLLTLTGFLGQLWWLFDLTVHFRVQYTGLLILCAVLLGIRRKFPSALVCLAFAIVNLVVVFPHCFGARAGASTAKSTVRVLLMNVETRN